MALEFRGEIITLPREKGDDRNLTQTPAIHERSPAWSPDGKWIAFFSDADGEYALRVAPQDGRAAARSIPLAGAGFYANLQWSPDATKLSYTDNAHSIWILDLATGNQTRVSSNVIYGPNPMLHHSWSPDSRWLAYTRNTPTYFNEIFLYSIADAAILPGHRRSGGRPQPGVRRDGQVSVFPGLDRCRSRQRLVLPGQCRHALHAARSISPCWPGTNPPPSPRKAMKRNRKRIRRTRRKRRMKHPTRITRRRRRRPTTSNADADHAAPKPTVTVDVDGLAQRILAMPMPAGVYADLTAGATNLIFYRRAASTDPNADTPVYRYDLTKRKEEQLLAKADSFTLSANTKRALLRVADSWHLVDLGDKLDLEKFKLRVDDIRVRVNPPAEWAQIFREAWRINRDYFYDPGYHGADWPAVRAKYEPFLAHLTTRNDLFRVIQWMLSELAVGHSYQSPGDSPFELETVPGGLLGADFEVAADRYRFRKVYGGLNWNPDLRSPLTEPGVDVKTGEYLLAVNGTELRPPDNLYQYFERTAGRTVELTVGPNPDGEDSRTVQVVPIENESALRNRDWVEQNLRRVTEATDGRVAYVYLPNTARLGHTYFKRYFFPQANREAIILDERHNGGGSVADYYIDILRRPLVSFWAMRYGADLKSPIAGIHGPKVMLIDETAGSGGDLLPWMFRKFDLGPLIGKRTWGGLVGILGFPVLMDGGSVTAPNLAIWTEDGFIVENQGVPPDIEVEQTPKDVIAGRDPQLEKAIEVILEQLEQNPPALPARPPFPDRVHPGPSW